MRVYRNLSRHATWHQRSYQIKIKIHRTIMIASFSFASTARVTQWSRAITFRFNSKTQWQMFLLHYAPCFCSSEGHKHGVSIQSSLNLGDTLLQITREWKTADLILGEVVYISIIYRIPGFWLYSLNGTIFSFDHMTGESRESTGHACLRSCIRQILAFSGYWTNRLLSR